MEESRSQKTGVRRKRERALARAPYSGFWILAPAFFLLNGCFLFSGGLASSSDSLIPDHLKPPEVTAPSVSSRNPYGKFIQAVDGQWATYSVVISSVRSTLTLGAVRREEKGTWIEVVEGENPRRVSARFINGLGVVEKALYREVAASGPSQVVSQPVVLEDEEQSEAPSSHGVEKTETSFIDQRPHPCTKTVEEYRDEALGRTWRIESFWSIEAPMLYDGSGVFGGLVRRTNQRTRLSVEITAAGEGYKPLIPDPK